MPQTHSISILVLGDTRRREFVLARASLSGSAQITEARTVDEAFAQIEAAAINPALIIVAQSYPGEFSVESLDRLRRRVPLARIVGLLGSWCEGETRTGRPWPGAIRLYWHQWIPQAVRELADLVAGAGSTWSLPATSTDEERLLAQHTTRRPSRAGLVAICAEQFEMHDLLAAAVASRGFSSAWLRPGRRFHLQGVAAALFDASSATENTTTALGRLRAELGPDVPIIALLDFPRIEDHDRVLDCGATAVLSKPLLLDDLFWQLDQATAND